ncbi:MAG: alpha/beta fold hydrolase [Ilumatobacteraceae bacterium]
MARAALPSGIELEYDVTGDPSDPTILLVCGFTSQMISWDDDFVALLAAEGLHVVRFDNRDCGLSTTLDGDMVSPGAVLNARLAGEDPPPVPYTLSDMAADGIGLLDHLGVGEAHVVGVSMGGMIVQTMAIEHPDRVASLTSIMSTTGAPDVGSPSPEALDVLLAPPAAERERYIEDALKMKVWLSRKHFEPDAVMALAAAQYDRRFYPEGALRQLSAIYTSGDRTEALRGVSAPTLVIHGRDDTLITPSGGAATAEAVPGSAYLLLSDMGHDRPRPLWPALVGAIAGHVRASIPAHV